MLSNLPDGMSEKDLPGNSKEEIQFDDYISHLTGDDYQELYEEFALDNQRAFDEWLWERFFS